MSCFSRVLKRVVLDVKELGAWASPRHVTNVLGRVGASRVTVLFGSRERVRKFRFPWRQTFQVCFAESVASLGWGWGRQCFALNASHIEQASHSDNETSVLVTLASRAAFWRKGEMCITVDALQNAPSVEVQRSTFASGL